MIMAGCEMYFELMHEVWHHMNFLGTSLRLTQIYLTNRYDMPFAHFVIVNHHG
jgi:hypothetical protein